MKKLLYIFFILTQSLMMSCDDQLEIEEKGVIQDEDALQSFDEYERLLNSAYDVLRGGSGAYLGGRTQVFSDLLSHQLDGRGLDADRLEIYNRSTGFFNGLVGGYFMEPYIAIYRSNTLISNIDNFTDASQNDIDRVKGEALFLRAISHLDLVRHFGQQYGFREDNGQLGVALRLVPSQDIQFRETVGNVYDQIIEDLIQAGQLLSNENNRGYGYATEWAAKGYLAKVYFQQNDYTNAYGLSDEVIENGGFTLDMDLTNRFSENGTTEAIFAMVSLGDQDNRGAEFTNLYRGDNKTPVLSIDENFYQMATSASDDARNNWYRIENEGTPEEEIYVTKFDNLTFFDVPLLHLTEMKLIRAESAGLLEENLNVAVVDINDIRNRAFGEGINPLNEASSARAIVEAARVERNKEMVAEGNYLFDQKRIGVLEGNDQIEDANWDCGGLLLQFPNVEIVEGSELNETGGC